jgi:hypothetical protein
MSRRHRLGSGRHYEELLHGARADDSALSALLDAARAPGTRDEMAGLPAARNAFLAAPYLHTRPAASVRRLPATTRTAAGRLLALKLVAAVSGVTLVGGAAYAATGAKLLGGGSSHHRTSASSTANQPGSRHHHGAGQLKPVGLPAPTPAGPVPTSAATHGKPGGVSSSAHEAHSPTEARGQSNAPGPHTSHPVKPTHPATPTHPSSPSHTPTPSHTPKPHHSPTPHDTKSHSPNPHRSSPGRGQSNQPKPSPSDSATS